MQVKTIYDMPEGWTPEYEGLDEFLQAMAHVSLTDDMRDAMVRQFRANARLLNQPRVLGYDVVDTGPKPEQDFPRDFVERGLDIGYMSRHRDQLIFHTQTQGDLHFTILRGPGYYCCHCNERIEDDPTGVLAKAHIARLHGEAPSPDAANPLGYRLNNGYECVLDQADHDVWNVFAQREQQRALGAQARGQNGQAQPPSAPHPSPEEDGR